MFASTDTVPVGNLGTGTPSGSTVLKGDGTWGAASGGITRGQALAQQRNLILY